MTNFVCLFASILYNFCVLCLCCACVYSFLFSFILSLCDYSFPYLITPQVLLASLPGAQEPGNEATESGVK